MNSSDLQLLEQLRRKVTQKEEELARLKETVNGLSEDAQQPKPYPDVRPESSAGDISSIRADQFYGQPLSTAIRSYLEMRKASAMGAASINEIYTAVKTGGFAFTTKDEENAKASVRLTLRKNSAVYHRLPNGQYGLRSWYTSIRPGANGGNGALKTRAKKNGKSSKISKGRKDGEASKSAA